jgi:hypothetical protein
MVTGGAVEAVVGSLADEVDPEGDDGNAQSRGGVAQLVPHRRVPPPLVPPPKELPRRVQPLPSARHRLSCSPFSLSLFSPQLDGRTATHNHNNQPDIHSPIRCYLGLDGPNPTAHCALLLLCGC